ncbi:hypothetical protein AB0368_30055 [Actinoplanes sp. NPDC051475]|uniref:T4 family baseplate hub assembly chaperone n=1 Tax=Actinoplanes sp. NPDC051475 TaxID=3157225 RepID=UPI00344E467B
MSGGTLPGGWFDAGGQLHRDFDLAVLTGREEELLTQARHPRPAALVTEVLSRCVRRIGEVSPVPPEVIGDLLVADRLHLLLQLRRATFGDRVRAALVCPWPGCGERVSLEFSLADVPVEPRELPGRWHTMVLSDGREVVFRLPTGADQEDLAPLAGENEGAALTALLTRCVGRLGGDDDPDLAGLSSRARAEIEDRMRQVAPSVAQTMDARCPECGRAFTAPFDVQRFFLGELRTDGTRLYQEIHYLAYHYHWSETEIMAMTRDKRQRYIDVLADSIEALNDAG